MLIKLAFKEYPFKITLGACKKFYDKTGLDLHTVFMRYICHTSKTVDMGLMERLVSFSELYPREIACHALHCAISAADESIPLAEIQDATYRVSWAISDREDGLSEPWPLVMIDAALQFNKYFSENTTSKKTDTSAE